MAPDKTHLRHCMQYEFRQGKKPRKRQLGSVQFMEKMHWVSEFASSDLSSCRTELESKNQNTSVLALLSLSWFSTSSWIILQQLLLDFLNLNQVFNSPRHETIVRQTDKILGWYISIFVFLQMGIKPIDRTDIYVRFSLLETRSVALQKHMFYNTNTFLYLKLRALFFTWN